MTPERRKFTKAFKLEVVRAYLTREPGEGQTDIGRRYDLGKSAISSWINRYSKQAARDLQLPAPPPDRRKGAPPARAPAPARPAPPTGRPPLDALASVINAIQPLGTEERRAVVRAVLGLLPP